MVAPARRKRMVHTVIFGCGSALAKRGLGSTCRGGVHFGGTAAGGWSTGGDEFACGEKPLLLSASAKRLAEAARRERDMRIYVNYV